MKDMIKDFTLELSRIALVAILPVLIASLENGDVDFKVLGVIAAIAVLKAIDRALHESGLAKKGLTRF